MNNLSIVTVVPEIHKDLLNELAELLGMGSNNLTVKLQNNAGDIFYGCHSWWNPEKYNLFKNIDDLASLGVDIERYRETILSLMDNVIDVLTLNEEDIFTVPAYNFNLILEQLGLTQIIEENQ